MGGTEGIVQRGIWANLRLTVKKQAAQNLS